MLPPPRLDPRKAVSIHLVRCPPPALCSGKEGISVGLFPAYSLHCPVRTAAYHWTPQLATQRMTSHRHSPVALTVRQMLKSTL